MTRVRMLVSLSGPAASYRPGDVAELDDADAGRLIAAGYARPVEPARDETAESRAATSRERAVTRRRS